MITVVLSVRIDVEYQIKLTSKFQNVQCRYQEPYLIVVVGGVACESSSLRVSDTANIGVA